jgi:hypothetical protein
MMHRFLIRFAVRPGGPAASVGHGVFHLSDVGDLEVVPEERRSRELIVECPKPVGVKPVFQASPPRITAISDLFFP